MPNTDKYFHQKGVYAQHLSTGDKQTNFALRPKSKYVDVFLLLCIFIILVFGGASRPEVLSNVVIRPIAIIGILVVLMNRKGVDDFGIFWKVAGGCWIGYTALQLVPLPPSLWYDMPGHDQFRAIAVDGGVPQTWRPISLVPWITWNGLFSAAIPAFGFVLATTFRDRFFSKYTLIILGFATFNMLIGIAQLATNFDSSLYLYDIANKRSLTGIFANRNHCSALFCISIVYTCYYANANLCNKKQFLPVKYSALHLLMMAFCLSAIATGSRFGAIMSISLLIFTSYISYRNLRNIIKINGGILLLLVLTFAVVASTTAFIFVYFQIDRWASVGDFHDGRLQILPQAIGLAKAFFPFGGGVGTFPYAYFAVEPLSQLDVTYINHAHNDVLESVYECGLPAVLLLIAGIVRCVLIIISIITAKAATKSGGFAAASIATVVILFLWSFFDYPVRTPALALVAVFALTGAESAFTRMPARGSGKVDPSGMKRRDKKGLSN